MCDHHEHPHHHPACPAPDHALTPHPAETLGKSLFIGVMGTPFQSDLATSIFRMVEEALRREVQVTVWTCGYGTTLTQTTLVRPRDPLLPADADAPVCPSTADLVQALFRKYPNLLRWYVCRYCMEERGATAQISDVEIQIPFSFNTYLNAADKALVLGVKS